jgi:hypothetical protein
MDLALLENLTGDEYLRKTWDKEDVCEHNTLDALSMLGVKAPNILPSIGRVLIYLEATASCAFGCVGGDHAMERLLFRSCNRSRAAIRLARLGFYDESLLLTRAIGETTNLLALFKADPDSMTAWANAESWTSKPVKIRCKLEELGEPVPADNQRYNLLSGLAAHNDPNHIPAAHNVSRRPVAPGTFSPEGLLLCLNELGLQLTFTALSVPGCFQLPSKAKAAVLKAGRTLGENLGGFTVDLQSEYWNNLRLELNKLSTDPQSADTPSVN